METKIKFATAILDFSRGRGGAESYLVDLCTRMIREGNDVHVYAESWDGEDSRIHFHRIKTIPFPKSLRLLSFALRATREIDRGGYDVSLGVGNTLKSDLLQPHGGVHWVWFWRSLRAYDHPILWAVKFLGRVLSPKQWMNGYIEDAPYRGQRLLKIVAISDMVKRDMVRWYRIPEGQIEVVYNGVDIERFHPRNRRYREEVRKKHGIGDEFVVLFVSNNFRLKGLGFLMKALAGLKGTPPAFKLLILGRDEKSRYLRLGKRLGLATKVVFAGPTGEPEKYYGASDLLVHPTFYDPCSLTVLEALASGLPVITTSSNGASGIISPGKEGLIISDPRDGETLGKQITFFFEREARERASAASRSLAEEYSLEKNWEAMKQIVEDSFRQKKERDVAT